MPETLPTTLATQFAWAPIDAWASAAASAAEYASRAIARTQHTTEHRRGPGGVRPRRDATREADLGARCTRSAGLAHCAIARLFGALGHCGGAHPGAPTTGRACVVDSRLRAGAEPDAHAARRRTRQHLRHRLGARDPRDRGLVDRGVRRRVGGRCAIARRAGQSRRRLPRRLARSGLRRPAPRPGEHAHHRRGSY